jgi:hypothetical protein
MSLNFKNAPLTCVVLGSTLMTSCAGHAYYSYGVPPLPPPRAVGAVGIAPGPGYVWIDGFYDLRGTAWVWMPGYWARPPRPGAAWVRPYWEPHGRGYRFHRGHWRR